MNKVLINGFLESVPERIVTKNGFKLSKFSVAVLGSGKAVDHITCIAWGDNASNILNIRKGIELNIEGTLKNYVTYKDKEVISELVVSATRIDTVFKYSYIALDIDEDKKDAIKVVCGRTFPTNWTIDDIRHAFIDGQNLSDEELEKRISIVATLIENENMTNKFNEWCELIKRENTTNTEEKDEQSNIDGQPNQEA